ncbi:MAG: RimK family alpha-L-glutamate ligase [Vampirovibrio sp.]|nr:RimK family alpha-L-glutamate ligase [Vampirovibrio sp.]
MFIHRNVFYISDPQSPVRGISANKIPQTALERLDSLHFSGKNKVKKPLNLGIIVGNIQEIERADIHRLKAVAESRGHQVTVLPVEDCQAVLQDKKALLLKQGKPIQNLDIVIPRLGSVSDLKKLSQAELLLGQCRAAGFPVLEKSPHGVSTAINKFRAHQVFIKEGIPTLNSAFSPNLLEHSEIINQIAKDKEIVVKLINGSVGTAVFRSSLEKLRLLFAKLSKQTPPTMVQEFIPEANGTDLRCFVAGDRVIAVGRRQAKAGDWKANVTTGATASKVTDLAKPLQDMAITALKAVGLAYGGVDIIHSKNGPAVLEINASPTILDMENVLGVSIAPELIKYVEHFVEGFQTQKTTAQGQEAASSKLSSIGVPKIPSFTSEVDKKLQL